MPVAGIAGDEVQDLANLVAPRPASFREARLGAIFFGIYPLRLVMPNWGWKRCAIYLRAGGAIFSETSSK